MENMCLSPLMCDGVDNPDDSMTEKVICDNRGENLSPTVETVTHQKKPKFIFCADDDIPSYQIVHGSKRFSDVLEEQESILPISPVITPPRIIKKENFQVPFVPTIGTIVKKNASFKAALAENIDVIPAKESTKVYNCAYEVLGMVDNDISWNSSMETPTHKLLPLGDYNTIEKATLLPEKDLKNMQPRVLFSPHENDDSECVPLKYSSESEDEKGNCSMELPSPIVSEINLKAKTSGSLEGMAGIKNTVINEKSPKTIVTVENFMKTSVLAPISPVFRINNKKSRTRQQKSLLVKSPDIAAKNNVKNSNCENSSETNKNIISDVELCDEVLVAEVKETNNDHNINVEPEVFHDDSFQNISISCFDELCNTSEVNDTNLACDNNITPAATKQVDLERNDRQKCNPEKNSSPTQKKLIPKKFLFYNNSRTDELHPVISIDHFLKSAEKFEEFNDTTANKSYETFKDDELSEFSKMVNDEYSGQGLKRGRPVSNKSPDACHKKKKKTEILKRVETFPECTKIKGERMEVGYVENQEDSIKAISAQSGINDNQISMTAVCGERLVDNMMRVSFCESLNDSVKEQIKDDQLVNNYRENSENNGIETRMVFSSTTGKSVLFSNYLDVKTPNQSDHDYKCNFTTELDSKGNNMGKSVFQGFQTASGDPVKVSEESLNKAKKLFLESDINNTLSGNDPFPEELGLTNASGSKVKISEESLKKAKAFFELGGIDSQDHKTITTKVTSKEFSGFKTASNKSVKITDESAKKARELWKEMDGILVEKNSIPLQDSDLKGNNMGKSVFQGFQTASGDPVKVSEESLNKAKKLFLESDINNTLSGNDPFPEELGLTNASGSKVKISEESLKKAKAFFELGGIDSQDHKTITTKVTSKEFSGFKTASNKSVKITDESAKKARELWKEMDGILVEKNSIPLQDSDLKENILRENTPGVPESADENCCCIKPDSRYCGFSTASGKNLSVSKNALKKARKILSEEIVYPEKKNIVGEMSGSINNNACPQKSADIIVMEKESLNQAHEEGNFDNSKLIPPWLHSYKTSPTFTLETAHFKSPMPSEECNPPTTPKERYLVKSPILGKTDRFMKKGNRNSGKELFFKSPNQSSADEDENRSGFTRIQNSSIKRDSSELGIDFSFLFKRKKIEDMADVYLDDKKPSFEVIDGRRKARLEQIKAGKKLKVNPIKGSHLLKKKQKQMSWTEALQGTFPERFPDETLKNYGIRDDILQITATTAHTYRFKAQDFFSSSSCLSNVTGFPVGDACLLIFEDDYTAGVEEIERAFFASPGVEQNLIHPKWVKNHYKWIVWKLSHYERSFPHIFGGNCLTPHNVMVQLKYRYDREIDGSESSALKKILESNESSRRRMVLCVSDIKQSSDLCTKNTESCNNGILSYVLELTDGWYSCCAQTDSAMAKLIEEGKVIIGAKLVTYGAELLVSDGVSPLESSGKIHLKIFTNSTRRVKWDTKLGFQKNGGPFLVSLNSILANGGLVGRLDVVIVRIYPFVYMEKRTDGTHVVRNRRMEDKAASEYQEQQEALFEKIYQQVKDELQSKAKEKERLLKKVTISDISQVTDAEELFRLYEGSSDPSSFQNLLTAEQSEILLDYQLRKKEITSKELSDMVQEKIKTEKVNIRKVSQLLRIKIVDLHTSDYDNPALLTIWNSTEDFPQILAEGKAISIFNTIPSRSRFHKPVQLNSTRYTQYKELTKIVQYPARKLVSLSELTADYEPVFNEIDLVGIVVFIRETSYCSRLSQTIYLADLEYNIIGLVFWGSCKNFGWENVLTIGSVVACSNLQWGNRRNFNGIPNVYVTDYSVFKDNPKENFFKERMKALKSSLPEDMKTFIGKCEDEIIAKLDDEKLSNVSRNTSLPCDSSNSPTTTIKPKYINGFKMKPNASSTPFKSRTFGLDLSDQEPSPIQKRIKKLQIYGEPPPLPLLHLGNLDKFPKFKPPFKSVADSSAK